MYSQFCRPSSDGHEFGLVIDGDEFCVSLGECAARLNLNTVFGGQMFATSSSLRPKILEKSCENEAGKRQQHHSNDVHKRAKDSGTTPILRFMSTHHFGLLTNRLIWLGHLFDPFMGGFLFLLFSHVTYKGNRCFGRRWLRTFSKGE